MRNGIRRLTSIFLIMGLFLQGIDPAGASARSTDCDIGRSEIFLTQGLSNPSLWAIHAPAPSTFSVRRLITQTRLHLKKNPSLWTPIGTVTGFLFLSLLHPHTFVATPFISLASLLFPGMASTKFLAVTEHHLTHAANNLRVSSETLQEIVSPVRAVDIQFYFRLNNGTMRQASAIRFVMAFPGKGGIRSQRDVDVPTVTSLGLDMDVKPPLTITLHGMPLRGAKGGSDVDLSDLQTEEKARWMRGWVNAVMDYVWKTENHVAFGPLFDTPAPDVGTSQNDLNLMDYFADEMNRWMLKNPDRDKILRALKSKNGDPIMAHQLQVVAKSLQESPVIFDEAGSQMELPYLQRIIRLREDGKINSLRLLAGVTGKTPPNPQLPYGYGGILGRGQATGMGLAFATLQTMILRHDLPAGSNHLDGKTVAIQGFGNVGQGATLSFQQLGAKVEAIAEFDSDTQKEFAYYLPGGFTPELIQQMIQYKKTHNQKLHGFKENSVAPIQEISLHQFWHLPVDVMAPAAKENVITAQVARLINTRYVAEGANGPTTTEGDIVLHNKGIVAIPDVVANSGGVLVSWMEMLQDIGEDTPWTEERVFAELRFLITQRLSSLNSYSVEHHISLRDAVHELWLHTRLPSRIPPGHTEFLKRAS